MVRRRALLGFGATAVASVFAVACGTSVAEQPADGGLGSDARAGVADAALDGCSSASELSVFTDWTDLDDGGVDVPFEQALEAGVADAGPVKYLVVRFSYGATPDVDLPFSPTVSCKCNAQVSGEGHIVWIDATSPGAPIVIRVPASSCGDAGIAAVSISWSDPGGAVTVSVQ
jgi:hypothetical protein